MKINMTSSPDTKSIIRIPPYHYIHVLDNNTNTVRLVTGPKTFVRQDHENIQTQTEPMVTLAANQYCVIKNPILRDDEDEAEYDEFGQVKLVHGDLDYRFHREPFPLYPGEVLYQAPQDLVVVLANEALILYAKNDFIDDTTERISGDKWLFEGPGTYKPRKEVVVEKTVKALEVKPNTALHMRAMKACRDAVGTNRIYGEEWLVKTPGAYLPTPYEELVKVENAVNIDQSHALLVQAIRTHNDEYGRRRNHGAEWLITNDVTESHIVSVNEKMIEIREAITLTKRQYCVILNPVDKNLLPQFGSKKLVKGEATFFLHPGESLESGIQSVYVLDESEALILRALENTETKTAGEQWMILGPTEYVPPVEVEVVDKRKAIPLDENEGIYVRDVKTGKVRSVIGETYILTQDEVLWEKKIPDEVRNLLYPGAKSSEEDRAMNLRRNIQHVLPSATMDLTKVVSFRVPHNAAVQIYDFKDKKARVIFGPELVMLGPDEQFTRLSLSGGKPKTPNMVKSLCLLLGPDFFTDRVTVETADHARLSLQLSYNWHFVASPDMDQKDAAKLFSVPDFVGDACKAIASRVRCTVAAVQFDDFHKNSARIIRSSVFGRDEKGKIRDTFEFPQNNLVITSIDVQSVEPVDQRTRDSLQKSVQLAIEITTNSQEAAARHEAERLEQEARGRLERQKIIDEAAAEESRRELLELQVQLAALESCGQAKAEAQSRAEAAKIEGQTSVEAARLKSEATDIEAEGELRRLDSAREAEIEFLRAKSELQMKRRQELMELEVKKFQRMMDAMGAENLKALALAGPKQDIRMLRALGLNSTLITDGSSPINLLQTANGLIGSAMGKTDKDSKTDSFIRPENSFDETRPEWDDDINLE